jgi:quinol-cytochrome oxidoreductase complex cytochrome b subunit
LTRFIRKDFLRPLLDHITFYPSPVNLNYNWGFGSLAIFYLILQLVSGILLTIYFTPTGSSAFESVQFIMREANYGWLIRYVHTTGSSVFFAVVYAHIGRGLYYGSFYYPRILVWYTGLLILLLMMGAAFFGYILPWGQMSFWAATVITNLFATIPYLGDDITLLLWGDYSVGPTTLKRFFTFHFIIPFLILGAVALHIVKLHRVGSNNPLGREHTDYLPLYPYFFVKDALFVYLSLILTGFFVSWEPNLFIHPDNNIAANALVTPEHIVPEWYFLPFYAILRTIPSKFLGFLCMMLSIVIMFFLPFLGSSEQYRVAKYYFLHKFFFIILLADFFVLGWLGGCSIEYPYLLLSRFCTFYYFFYFFVILPFFLT